MKSLITYLQEKLIVSKNSKLVKNKYDDDDYINSLKNEKDYYNLSDIFKEVFKGMFDAICATDDYLLLGMLKDQDSHKAFYNKIFILDKNYNGKNNGYVISYWNYHDSNAKKYKVTGCENLSDVIFNFRDLLKEENYL